ncbi:MAG: hypothetical protein P794_00540 [Epsilonproteobacteria bacterium (ex Lamellibrachia satsuma)]|nr:MAG: hypothetical protein P794_00540 [Epsilonproteobacteria bacterium (ex Lamellibrachia satsuma)]
MSNLTKFFNGGVHGKELMKNLDDAIAWENETVSNHSPCSVKNNEKVARQIHSPIHVMETNPNQLTNLAFEDMINKGLSINRLKYAISKDDLHKRGREKAARDRKGSSTRKAKPDRKYFGLAFANVIDIRSVVENDKRCFVIYDTSSVSCPSHADLYCIINDCRNEMVKTRQARKLQKIFSTIEKDPNQEINTSEK